jgi:hypothetical protein
MADIEAADKVSRITGHRSRAVFDAYADHVTEAAVTVFAGVPAGAAMARGPGHRPGGSGSREGGVALLTFRRDS